MDRGPRQRYVMGMATTKKKSRTLPSAPKKAKAKKPANLVDQLVELRQKAEAEGIVLDDGTLFADARPQ